MPKYEFLMLQSKMTNQNKNVRKFSRTRRVLTFAFFDSYFYDLYYTMEQSYKK